MARRQARAQVVALVLLASAVAAAACGGSRGGGAGGAGAAGAAGAGGARRMLGAAGRANARRCPVGLTWTAEDVRQKQANFYARVVQRFGEASAQARAFVPAANLTEARALAAARGPLAPANAPLSLDGAAPGGRLDAEALAAVTAQVEAFKRAAEDPAAAAAAAGGRRLQAAATTITIRTFVHAITNTAKADYLSDAVINAQIKVMNDAFAPWGFAFSLASINRVENNAWASIADSLTEPANAVAMKKALHRGSAADLNLYLVPDLGNLLGYAYLPEDYDSQPLLDGVVLLSGSLPGVVEGSLYNEGDTATHEVGHWLGLLHTFQDGCARNAALGGDLVTDTPAERSANLGTCRLARNTCRGRRFPGNDPVNNFMDYSPDSCMNTFTAGQAARMLEQFATYRAQ